MLELFLIKINCLIMIFKIKNKVHKLLINKKNIEFVIHNMLFFLTKKK